MEVRNNTYKIPFKANVVVLSKTYLGEASRSQLAQKVLQSGLISNAAHVEQPKLLDPRNLPKSLMPGVKEAWLIQDNSTLSHQLANKILEFCLRGQCPLKLYGEAEKAMINSKETRVLNI